MSDIQDRVVPGEAPAAPAQAAPNILLSPATNVATASGGRIGMLLRLAVLAGAVALAWFVAARWNAWVGSAAVQTTNDAYLAADLTPLSARVSGVVLTVPVRDYQRVRAGDLLVHIRDDDYRAQVAQAEANLAAAEAQLGIVQAESALQQANINAAEANVEAQRAGLRRDGAESTRQRELLTIGLAGTRQRVEQADASNQQAEATLQHSRAQLEASRRQIAVYAAQERQSTASVAAQQAALDLARINLGYARITAPEDGVVGQRQVRPGQYVGMGTQVITIVPLPEVWVIASYKETQLTRMAPGQPATVTVDAFLGVILRGRVEGFSPASGSQFSLLPPDNATGNFTKVVQRISVKIVLEDVAGLADRLRPGMSVITSVRVQEE